MSETVPPPQVDLFTIVQTAWGNPGKERIFTLMGPNGAGKSRLLEQLEGRLRSAKIGVFRLPAIRILPTSEPLNAGPSNSTPLALSTVIKQQIDFAHASFWAADSFFKSAEPRENKFKDQLLQFWRSKKAGPEPLEPEDQVDSLRKVLNRLLGYTAKVHMEQPPAPPLTPQQQQQIQQLQSRARTQPQMQQQIQQIQQQPKPPPRPEFTFQRAGHAFNSTGLSDGEKQILMLAWMLTDNNKERFVFLVDEPELYLNEARAIRFWEELENYYQSAIFLYATHNIVFATRPRVHCTFLMDMNQSVEPLPRDEPLPHAVVRDMVGARVQILRVEKPIVFCEDTMLRYIAADLLGSNEFDFVILEGHATVVSAVSKDSLSWSKIRSPWKHCGIIDRDARDEKDVETLAGKNVFCFPLFEAESLLMVPELAIYLLSLKGKNVPIDDFRQMLLGAAKAALVPSVEAVRAHVRRWGQADVTFEAGEDGVFNVNVAAPVNLAQEFERRSAALYEAIKKSDIQTILSSFDGKRLCAHCANASNPAFGAIIGAHPENDYDLLRRGPDFPAKLANLEYLTKWRDSIRAHLSAPS